MGCQLERVLLSDSAIFAVLRVSARKILVRAETPRSAEIANLDGHIKDVWGGDALAEFGKMFWQASLDKGRLMLERAVFSHIATSHYAAPLLIETGPGLIVEVARGKEKGSE